MPFSQTPTRLGGRHTDILLIALPIILITFQLALPDYQPSAIELVLLILQAPCLILALRLPQIAALSYVLISISSTLLGGALGLTSFLALVLIALLLRKNVVIWALAVGCASGFSGFYETATRTFDFDHTSVLVWGLLLLTAIAIGLWLRHSDNRAVAAQQQLLDRREKVAGILHDSIAANLSAITTKLEALAFQHEDTNPTLAQDLSTVADSARTTITHTRQLLDSLTTDRIDLGDQTACVASLGELIDKAVHCLTTQGFRVAPVLFLQAHPYPLPTLRILDHAVTEAVTNIIKYATPHSTITLEVTEGSKGTTIAFENFYHRRPPTNDSSRMGLRLLRQDLDASSGDLSLMSTDETWTAVMTIPHPNSLELH